MSLMYRYSRAAQEAHYAKPDKELINKIEMAVLVVVFFIIGVAV